MKFLIISVGKHKDSPTKQIIDDYIKRLNKYINLEMIELQDEPEPKNPRDSDIEIIKFKESQKIMNKLKENDYIYSLCIDGQTYNSIEFSKEISQKKQSEYRRIVFIIGGSRGIHDNIIELSNKKISFSRFTFPHNIAKILLLEQLYRSEKIQNNEIYHK